MKPAAIGLAAILTVVAGAASAQSAPVASSRTVPAQVQNSADAALDELHAAGIEMEQLAGLFALLALIAGLPLLFFTLPTEIVKLWPDSVATLREFPRP